MAQQVDGPWKTPQHCGLAATTTTTHLVAGVILEAVGNVRGRCGLVQRPPPVVSSRGSVLGCVLAGLGVDVCDQVVSATPEPIGAQFAPFVHVLPLALCASGMADEDEQTGPTGVDPPHLVSRDCTQRMASKCRTAIGGGGWQAIAQHADEGPCPARPTEHFVKSDESVGSTN